MSVPFRLCGVSYNTVLDVAAVDAGELIRVAVQLPSGTRAIVSASAAATLGEILHPVAVKHDVDLSQNNLRYMSTVLTPGAVAVTTLLGLGIRSGSALFRLVAAPSSSHQDDESKAAATDSTQGERTTTSDSLPSSSNAAPALASHASEKASFVHSARHTCMSAALTDTPREAADSAQGEQTTTSYSLLSDSHAAHPQPAPAPQAREKASFVHSARHMSTALTDAPDEPTEAFALAKLSVDGESLDVSMAHLQHHTLTSETQQAVSLIVDMLDRILRQPDNVRFRRVRVDNAKFFSTVGCFDGAVGILVSAGFTVCVDADCKKYLQLPQRADMDHIEMVRSRCASLLTSLGVTVRPCPDRPVPATIPDFDPFRPLITRTAPVPTRSGLVRPGTQAVAAPSEGSSDKTRLERRIARLKAQQDTILQQRPAWRETLLVQLDGAVLPASVRAPQSSRAPSESDGALLRNVMKQRRKQLAEASVLTTSAMREVKALQEAKVYSSALVKVHFPDGNVVQGKFSPSETVTDIYEWLSCLLRPSSSFHLYITPPKTVLARHLTLLAASLVPAAKLYVSWDAEPLPGHYFLEAFQASFGSYYSLPTDLPQSAQAATTGSSYPRLHAAHAEQRAQPKAKRQRTTAAAKSNSLLKYLKL